VVSVVEALSSNSVSVQGENHNFERMKYHLPIFAFFALSICSPAQIIFNPGKPVAPSSS